MAKPNVKRGVRRRIERKNIERARRACMPGTASGKLHLRQKAKS